MSESSLVTLWQIAEATDTGRTDTQIRARLEHWPYELTPCGYRGGRPARLYDPADLPEDVRAALEDWPPDPPDRHEDPARRRCLPDSALVACGADRLRREGVLQSVWADSHGFSESTVSKVFRGVLRGTYGASRRIALALQAIGAGGRIPGLEELQAESARRLARSPAHAARDRRDRDRRICARHAGGEPAAAIAADERLSASRVRQIVQAGPPDPEPEERPVRIPEGHPSRYRILKPSRIPEWAREGLQL